MALICTLGVTGCAKRYPVEGLVLRVERDRQTVTISHREILGYMPAMVMPFRLKNAAELSGLAPGARVEFQLEVGKRGAVVRNLRAQALAPDGVVAGNGQKLRLPPTPEKVAIGATVPDFTLTDQSSRPVHLADFRGRVVALNFVYTRCPLPDVCPRLCAGFARLQKRFAGRDLALLSVTLDPQYDSPEVLAGYAKIWRADPWFVVRSVSSRVYDNLFWHAAAPGSSQSFWNWGLPGLAFIGGIWLFLRGGERRLVAIAAAALFLVACGAIGFVYYINDNYANITQIFLIVLAAGAADFVAALAPAWKRPRLRAIASLGRAHSIALASVLSATVAIAIVLSLPAVRRFLSPPPPTEVWVEAQAPTSDDLRTFGEKWQAFATRELRVVRGYDFEARMSRPPVWVAREAAGPAFNALSKSASAVAGWRTRSVAGFEPDSPESWDGRLLRVELEPSTGLQQSRVEKLMIEKFNRWGFRLRERRGDEFVFRLE